MDIKLKNVSYLRCRTHCITHSKSFVAVHLPHTVLLHLLAGFVLSAVCSYLTLFTLLGFGVFRSCR